MSIGGVVLRGDILGMERLGRREIPIPLMDRHPLAAIVLAVGVCALSTPALAQQGCDPLPPPAGSTIDVHPADAGVLRNLVASASSGTTILLHDGTYDLACGDSGCRLQFSTPGVTLRSVSGNRNAVILDGAYNTNELISIYASGITIADLTVARAYDHPIHISGPPGSPISGILLHNLRVVDPGQQAIKSNPNVDGWVDHTTVQCCAIELTDVGRGHIRDGCYTGGIDVHKAQGWVVRRNYVSGFWCDDGLSEHGIHFWQGCRDTIVEENLIVDCARGIGFGLGSSGDGRTYPDDPYPGVGYMGHIDGVIRNNFVAAGSAGLFASPDGFDTGIGLEQAYGAVVVHNSVASTQAPLSSSIEWRFVNSVIDLANNLSSHIQLARDGAQATAGGNISDAPQSWFQNIAAGDLHLTAQAAPAVDTGAVLAPGLADTDFDGEPRDALPDVGGDELTPGAIFSDGFDSGDTSAWSGIFP